MILVILSFIAGIAFCAAGVYFLLPRYLDKLNEATSDKSPETQRKNQLRAKSSGYVALGLGALTLVLAFMLISFPQIASPLVLVYMIFVLAAVSVLLQREDSREA
jgi:hypothetical protein